MRHLYFDVSLLAENTMDNMPLPEWVPVKTLTQGKEGDCWEAVR